MKQTLPRQFLFITSVFGCGHAIAVPPKAPLPRVETTYNYYVATNGSDSNPGTAELPFLTILRASKVALPGTTIHVAPGTYAGGFKTVMSGTEGQRIYYQSTVKWGAKLVPPTNSENKYGWENRGNYVDIAGFDIDGSNPVRGIKWTHGIYNGGSRVLIRDNHVHHLARDIGCTSAGGAGIGIDSYYGGVQSDVVGNTVHDIGAPGCRFVQGIYISTSGSAKNNVVYRIGGAAIQMWHDAHSVVVSNNTVASSTTGILVGGGDFYRTKGPNDNTSVHNNIVYDNKYGISEQGATGANNTYRNNLVYQNPAGDWTLRNGLKHFGTVTQAPQFLKYGKQMAPDFRLKSNSPAIGKGTDDQASLFDAQGRLRTKSSGIDIGAFQHN